MVPDASEARHEILLGPHGASLEGIAVDWAHLTATLDLTTNDHEAMIEGRPPFRPVQIRADGLRELRLPPRRIRAESTMVDSLAIRPGPDDPWGLRSA